MTQRTAAPKPSKTMRAALKRVVLPELRARGFSGELPHLRRLVPDATHTFTVQVSRWGGELIVELGRAPAGPYVTASGEAIAPDALQAFHMRDGDRARLRAVPNVLREVWFSYKVTLRDRVRRLLARVVGRVSAPDPFERAARQVLLLLPECDRWWAGEDGLPHVRSFAEQFAGQGS